MHINLRNILKYGEKIAVAVSGGCDSMSLLYYLQKNASLYGISVLAINVEHGIRGQNSISDTEFVKNYCKNNSIKLITYSVDSIAKAKKEKLSLEQAARALRYECFQKAISSGECDKVATAHHSDDNTETMLFNIFRGTGLKGLTGIIRQREDNIIRPFLNISRKDIEHFAKENNIPYVTDETNLSDEYTRNYVRHNIIPEIKKIFPELNQSLERLSVIASQDENYINSTAKQLLKLTDTTAELPIPCHPSIVSRAVVLALKHLGVTKDWEKVHIDDVIKISMLNNGSMLNLPKNIVAVKEYDKIVFFKKSKKHFSEIDFSLGEIKFLDKTIKFKQIKQEIINLKSGIFLDLDKIPPNAKLRTRKPGDTFKKFGGGSKSLGDYFTDIKLPLRTRDKIILLVNGKEVLAILGIAISETVKVDKTTKRIISAQID